ncbi:hypothetical protein OAC76_06855 [Amylibacter sp.]|nr:hypothetical protein [Amylibacter sp.]
MKINNSLDVARWEKLTCSCNHDSVETEYPIHKCEHCKCKEAWDSVPQKDFSVIENDYDNDDNIIGDHERLVKEITLIRGNNLQDVIGWTF